MELAREEAVAVVCRDQPPLRGLVRHLVRHRSRVRHQQPAPALQTLAAAVAPTFQPHRSVDRPPVRRLLPNSHAPAAVELVWGADSVVAGMAAG